MKKLTLLCAAMVAALSAAADHVTPEQALGRLHPSQLRRAPGHSPLKCIAELPELYVFSSGTGYLLLPADDAAPALLGYADSGTFSLDGNPAFAWWLEGYSRQIQFAAASAAPSREMMRISRPAIEPMIQTRWDQGEPYNLLCPELSGKRCVTGCVATAMAQVLRFHSWPVQGKGTHSYVWSPGGKTLSFDYASTTFRWELMPDRYSASSTAGEKEAVATLMYAAGVSVDMNYTASESGAVSRNMGPALLNYFNYDQGLWMPERDYYELAEWEEMIYSELAQGRPVLYGGTGSAGGHQFICDGYSADGYFHFNWGWGGMSDGYFLLTALNPPSLGIGGGAGGFNYNQSVLLGVQPPVDGSKPAYVLYCSGFEAAVTETALGTPVEFGKGFFNYSFTSTPAETEVGIKISPVEPAGEAVYVTALTGAFRPEYGTRSLTAELPDDLASGVYRITPAYRIPGEQWTEMRAPLSDNASLTATVSGQSVSFSEPQAPQIAVSDLQLLTPLYWGAPFKLSFTVTNEGESEYYGGLIPALVSAQSPAIVATSTTYPVDLIGGDSQTADYVGTFRASAEPVAGIHQLVLLDSSGAIVGGPIEVTLNAAPEATSAEVISFALDGGNVVTSPADATFSVELQCTEGYFAEALTVAVFPETGGASLASGRTDVYYLEQGSSATSKAVVNLSALTPGRYMAAVFHGGRQLTEPLYFTIDTAALGVIEVTSADHDLPLYDLMGRRVAPGARHGIFITASGRRIVR